jgi:hypothetical protein
VQDGWTRRGGDLDLGRVIGRSFGALRADALLLLVTGAVLVGGPAAVYGWLRVSGVVASPGADMVAAFRGAPGETLVSSLLGVLYAGGAMHVALARLRGESVGLTGMLEGGRRFFLPLLGINIVTSLGIGVGLILLIVPGLILLSMWAVAAPARVAGRPGVLEAMDRSVKLTQGQRWRVLALVLLGWGAFLAFAFGGGWVSASLEGYREEGGIVTEMIFSPLLQLLAALLANVGTAALFHELTLIKEGPDVDAVAAVFA